MAVETLRVQGHDLLYVGEREIDPGDLAILLEAAESGRVLLTKDHDIGILVFREGQAHAGVLLIDDLGSAPDETRLLVEILTSHEDQLAAGAFIRAGRWGHRLATSED